jgi:hypothetical protein
MIGLAILFFLGWVQYERKIRISNQWADNRIHHHRAIQGRIALRKMDWYLSNPTKNTSCPFLLIAV